MRQVARVGEAGEREDDVEVASRREVRVGVEEHVACGRRRGQLAAQRLLIEREREGRGGRTAVHETALKVDDERQGDDVKLVLVFLRGREVEEVALDNVRRERFEVDRGRGDPRVALVCRGARGGARQPEAEERGE